MAIHTAWLFRLWQAVVLYGATGSAAWNADEGDE